MAAWAQAIISGLAIYYAVKAVDRQHRLEQQREREQHRLDLRRERDRDRTARLGRLGAVEAELKSCAEQCEIYTVTSREGPMLAPAYRLPLVAYNSVLPLLLADGVLSEDAARSIGQYYVDAVSFNRCLDRLDQMQMAASTSSRPTDDQLNLAKAEVQRCQVKALHLIGKNAPQRQVYKGSDVQATVSRLDPALAALVEAKHSLDRDAV